MTDWSRYASAYDLILEHNPAYRQLVATMATEISSWDVPKGGLVADVGAGTGNFSVQVARRVPHARVLHIDRDPGMNQVAETKRARAGLDNLEIITASIDEVQLDDHSLAGVIGVHSLYTLTDPFAALCRMTDWLQPGGRAFLCDLGRTLDIGDWFRFFMSGLLRDHGISGTARVLWRGREVLRQNRAIREAQLDGRYWTHNTQEFVDAVTAAGLSVDGVTRCYRGYSDLVIAHRPALNRSVNPQRVPQQRRRRPPGADRPRTRTAREHPSPRTP